MPNKKEKSLRWDQNKLFFFLILPFLAGLVLSSFIPRPVIGTITMVKAIDDSETDRVINQIRYAETHPEIRAVVLIQDCPGGTINGTELIYLELLKLRQSKPVVTMVEGLSASGSFYILSGTDYIFANPSSMVGNVGVVGTIPSKPRVYEDEYSTGPYKLWGWPQDTYIRLMDMMKSSFLQAVLNGRGQNLKVTPERILRGEIYSANDALRLGLIDALGPLGDAIDKAGDMAHISHYDLADLGEKTSARTSTASTTTFFELDEKGNSTGKPRVPGLYYLYIPEI